MGLSTKVQSQVREAAVAELRAANMEDMTERKLRTALEKRLGLELGGSDERQFLRTVINEFLDEEQPEEKEENEEEEEEEEEEIVVKRRKTSEKESSKKESKAPAKAEVGQKKAAKPEKRQVIGDGNLVVCELSNNRKVTVSKWKNQKLVNIREYYEKDGEVFPGKKGISLTLEQWKVLRDNMDEVDLAIKQAS